MLRGIAAARGPGPQDLAITQAERLLRNTGDDRDRRCQEIRARDPWHREAHPQISDYCGRG
ncbi:hypothetical protein [Streptomyces sp. A012304]|uniref:hypothetical protein n=1 Tax=Streptomyces sp. A012304 TaxID=375446 RepID=UPI0022306301|nr:hypothetical protein [Streptomyces sp. A012304]GKQ37349.1 hypothetical protein ALMP_38870 [Streptomyces sp. A012304]